MRRRFNPEPTFQTTPIEKILLPLDSRDELPPILAGLQWIWTHPTLKPAIMALLEARLLAGKKATVAGEVAGNTVAVSSMSAAK